MRPKSKKWVLSVDHKENPVADYSVVVTDEDSFSSQHLKIQNDISKILTDFKFDAIICVAGGWAGGNASHKDFIKNTELMLKKSVWTSCIASTVAASFLAPGGLLVLTGAEPALGATPGMIGYGLAKAAVHQLTKSLAAKGSGLPSNSHVAAILP
ncbi:dihydropteridine reductase [Paragonimus westermani]|uniref:Dihydropteridine reductase n=1 Tax=Paragonimus westermani TaxID=34504 RepID=A0A5J4NM96_9TREM|nr:dihydropteridine reductase [Paragonimus westermani]